MSDFTSMASASQKYGGFYVPQFQIKVLGAELPGDVLRDVVEITYKDKLEEIDSCEIVVNNWDTERRRFKYIGSEDLDESGQSTSGDPDAKYWTVFDPCAKQVDISLGYAPGPLEKLITGTFVTCEPNFPASGPPVLSVRVLNLMHKLRSTKRDQQYTTKDINPLTDSAIADYIDKTPDPKTKQPRIPIAIVTDPNAKGKEPVLPYVIQKSQYDIDFLWWRARTNGYDLRIQEDGSLFFGPSTAPDKPVYLLNWGQSLIDFKPTMTTGNQYKSVTVKGFDRATQKVIEEKVDYTDPDVGKYNKNLHYLLEQCDPREETVVDKPVSTKEEARQVAASVLGDQQKRMVKCTGTTVGLPQLRAGSRVQIGGAPGGALTLGSRLSGTYFVTATTHVFNNSGYTTRFEARREDQGTGQ